MRAEEGGQLVREILAQSRKGRALVFASFISSMELLYGFWRKWGPEMAKVQYDQFGILPVQEVWADEALKVEAARIKATYSLSLADAWIAATAILKGAILVHKDSEFIPLGDELQSINLAKVKSLK